jgi:enoyl-CoA hydratase/carnithine racemase
MTINPERVTITIENHVAQVRLTRADKMNAVDPDMAEAVVAAGRHLMGLTDLRAVVISGEGRGFCAGLDVASFAKFAATDPESRIMPRTHDDANLMQEVAMVWQRVPVPVIAAVHGVAFGAGFQLALGADIRIAHPETKLAIMEMKWGLVPDMGGMVLLPKLARSDVIRRMTFTAEPILAPQALDWGMVTELSDTPLEAATALANTIASKSPTAMRAAKRLLQLAESGASQAEVLYAESREQTDLIGKPDQLEQIAANLQNRVPAFKPR